MKPIGVPPFKIRIDLVMPPMPQEHPKPLCKHCGEFHPEEEECEIEGMKDELEELQEPLGVFKSMVRKGNVSEK